MAHIHALSPTLSARHQMHFAPWHRYTVQIRRSTDAVRINAFATGGVWPTEISLSSYSRSDGGPFVRGPRRIPYAGPLTDGHAGLSPFAPP